MTQKISPFSEVKYGWNFGESGWNSGMDENLLKFSALSFNGLVDGIGSTLPNPPSSGTLYFLTTDNRLYYYTTTWDSTPLPDLYVLKDKSTGGFFQLTGSTLVEINSPTTVDEQLETINSTILSLGTAAFSDTDNFVEQSALDIIDAQLSARIETVESSVSDLSDSVLAVATDVEAVKVDIPYSESKSPLLVDMHFGALKGVGFLAGTEPGGVTTTTTTASASGNVLSVVNSASFHAGQLICYVGADGDYYSGVVDSVSTGQITLQAQAEVSVSSGAIVSNFYSNESHPNVNGYKTISDYALRTLALKREVVAKWLPSDGLTSLGATSIEDYSTLSYDNPASTTEAAKRVITSGLNTGAKTSYYNLPAGQYVARFKLTPNLTASSTSSTIAATLGVLELTSSEITIASKQVSGNTAQVVELPFFKKSSSTVAFRVLNSSSNTLGFAVGQVEVVRVTHALNDLNKGVHVLLGDSWFVQEGMATRLQEKLPNASFINKGVGGNRADQLVSRFDVDVSTNNPDFVWVMVGTNDVAQSIPINTFGYNVGFLNTKISGIGAQGIFFDCSVGSTNHSTLGDLLTNSRQFALKTDYLPDSAARVSGLTTTTTEKFRTNLLATIPASSTKRVVVFPGLTTKAATIDKLYIVGSTATVTGDYRYGYGGSASSTISEDLVTAALSSSVLTNLTVAKSNTNPRFLLIEVQNTGASSIEVIGFVEATWSPQ